MPDEIGTESTRSDAPRADDSLFGDAAEKADDAPEAVVEEQDAQGAADAGDKTEAEAEAAPAAELKVVVSIMGRRAVIGVQQPSADPHIETFKGHDLSALAQEVTAVTGRARTRWEEALKHPAYERPAPPAKRRGRRQQGAAQNATVTQEAETQQQPLRLF